MENMQFHLGALQQYRTYKFEKDEKWPRKVVFPCQPNLSSTYINAKSKRVITWQIILDISFKDPLKRVHSIKYKMRKYKCLNNLLKTYLECIYALHTIHDLRGESLDIVRPLEFWNPPR